MHAESLDAYIATARRSEQKLTGSNILDIHLAPCVPAHPRSYLLVRIARRVRVHTLKSNIVFTTPSLTPARLELVRTRRRPEESAVSRESVGIRTGTRTRTTFPFSTTVTLTELLGLYPMSGLLLY